MDRGLTGGSKTTWDELVWRGEPLSKGPRSAPESEWITLPVEFSYRPMPQARIRPTQMTKSSGNCVR